MPRTPRKKLKFDENSVNELLQEIYNDNHNTKAKIARLFTKWEQYVREGGEIQAIGDQIVKLITAESKFQDQKIMLLKYLKEVVYDKKGTTLPGEDDKTNNELSSDERNKIINMVRKDIDGDE
ncbi:MAG: hypothetical protein ACOC2W_00900 [bacterium]